MDNSVIITTVTPEEFAERIRTIIREELGRTNTAPPDESGRYITRRQVADKANLSLPTVDKYSGLGIFKGYRIGSRVLFIEREVDEAITKSLVISRKSKGKS